MRTLVTAAGLAGAIAIAGLAAWLIIDPAAARNDTKANASAPAAATSAPSATTAVSAAQAPASTSSPTSTFTPASTSASQSMRASTGQTTPQPQPIAQGQQAFIDPVTGQLRPAEHEDISALQAAAVVASAGARRFARTAAVESQEETLPDGSTVATVPEELHTFSVASRTPDGRLVFEHAMGPTEAKALVKARATTRTGGAR